MVRTYTVAALALVAAVGAGPGAADPRQPLEYAPAPVDNPLKGLVPYQADVRTAFPHSLEFTYLPYSALVTGADAFDWRPLDRALDDIAGRGHQAVFRIFLEYPNKTGAVPAFLLKGGLKVTKWRSAESDGGAIETPDYADKNLRKSLTGFIAALGKRYDGDPRVGFVTAGLLGLWGEWHTYPREELFASTAVQIEVLDAYEAAFKVTPVLLRYPVGAKDDKRAANADRRFGYHDDSFAWATLDTGRRADDWFYMAALKAAGPDAENKWKTCPIGGEIRPEAWGRVFDRAPGHVQIQNFRTCVEATHVTWLMDSGMFAKKQGAERVRRAEEEVRRMGYEFHAPAVTIGDVQKGQLSVRLELENRGVAPFYYDWKPEWGLLADGAAVKAFAGTGKLTGLLPGAKPRVWAETLDVSGVRAGRYALAVRVPNPLKGGKPVRFANTTQAAAGWLALGEVRVP
ncbi:DUF4832 domain-containing protein [Frigoriglobus tundricola]|uniref:DUF4832 domain-containing protein n=1 Tax=Frigoriglobus tundricola TaxID=2774151 RepID=A0A6M5YXA6_9BACT|nr:DUF4832 domain-containing protein [Frigoriglobus tundricola]QJW98605.1 hypothetical protein FTUN_6200 [Frigoriglobus tundricola]